MDYWIKSLRSSTTIGKYSFADAITVVESIKALQFGILSLSPGLRAYAHVTDDLDLLYSYDLLSYKDCNIIEQHKRTRWQLYIYYEWQGDAATEFDRARTVPDWSEKDLMRRKRVPAVTVKQTATAYHLDEYVLKGDVETDFAACVSLLRV